MLGFGVVAYFLMRPAPVQTVRLEPVTPLPSTLSSPAPEIPKPIPSSEAPTIKPKPTKPIEPRQLPRLQPQANQQPSKTPSQPVPDPTSSQTQNSTSSQNSTQPSSSQTNSATSSSLPVRQEAGTWSIQAGAFRTDANAEALVQKLTASGFPAQVSQGENGIFRVLVGRYATSAEARAQSQAVQAATR